MDDLFSQFPTLQRTAADIITAADLRARLASGRPLRINYGVDVTAPFPPLDTSGHSDSRRG